ncbi:porin family protein [Flavobacterium sp.]|uniref:porin family protein n=1 Tax=Flavobacterium sp. TaxID=239 RepID=UPI00261C5FC7|nr:porin family protein [Flavobacterium sp.]
MEKQATTVTSEREIRTNGKRKSRSKIVTLIDFNFKSLVRILDNSFSNRNKMKNTINIIMIALFVGFSQTSKAQESASSSDAKFGIKGGVNFSNMYTNDVDDKNVLVGFNVGLFAKLPVADFISIQPEMYFTTKGAELTYNNAFAEGTAKFRLNYVEVPLLLMINLTDNFNIHGGPYVAYLIDGKTKNDSSNNLFDSEDNLDSDDFNKIDAGLAVGLGIDVDKFSIGARYNYGLTTVGKDRDFGGTTYTFPDGKNSVLSLYMALAF